MNWIADKLIGAKLSGWKSKFGGLALILSGGAVLVGLGAKAASDAADGRYMDAVHEFTTGDSAQLAIASIGMGYAGLGIAHKVEKAASGELAAQVAPQG